MNRKRSGRIPTWTEDFRPALKPRALMEWRTLAGLTEPGDAELGHSPP
jgi:hypothetical protein